MKTLAYAMAFLLSGLIARGQPTGIPLYLETPESHKQTELIAAAQAVLDSGQSLTPETVRQQFHRSSCQLELLKPSPNKLPAREIWQQARAAYVRIGWFYFSPTNGPSRVNLSGGYALTSDGAIATAYHIIEPPRDLQEGCLIAADDTGKTFPVIEILAANRYSDTCILRLKNSTLKPLALSTNSAPGDPAYCLSDPVGRHGYFSQGIVNRYFQLAERRLPHEPGAPLFAPIRMNVSTDWSFGSSGAPVLDDCGNVIGQVSTISVETGIEATGAGKPPESLPAPIIFHEAVSAHDVLALIKPGK